MRVAVLAGRRIDETGAAPRFPLENTGIVRDRLEAVLSREKVAGLVSAAACGADLIALDLAGRMGLGRRIVLPYASERFRESSVIDRPGDWGPIFDRIIAEVGAVGDVVALGLEGDDAFSTANEGILDEAERLANHDRADLVAIVVWEGASRGEGDVTGAFAASARARNLRLIDVLTTQ